MDVLYTDHGREICAEKFEQTTCLQLDLRAGLRQFQFIPNELVELPTS